VCSTHDGMGASANKEDVKGVQQSRGGCGPSGCCRARDDSEMVLPVSSTAPANFDALGQAETPNAVQATNSEDLGTTQKFQVNVTRKSSDEWLGLSVTCRGKRRIILQKVMPGGLIARLNDEAEQRGDEPSFEINDEITCINGRTTQTDIAAELREGLALNFSIARRSPGDERKAVKSKITIVEGGNAAPSPEGEADRAAGGLSVLTASTTKKAALYMFKGSRYYTIDDLEDAVKRDEKTEATQDKLAAQMQEGAGVEDKVRKLFREYAGDDERLEPHEMEGLAASMAAELGIDPRAFGDLNHIFWRFDFSGDGALDEEEGVRLIETMLRTYRDKMKPPSTGQPSLINLPFKKLSENYKLGTKMGQGGQGAIYSAVDKATGNKRVVKMFDKSNANAPLDDIKAEFKILRGLDHPKIQRLYDIFEDRVNVYIISEPYGGGDLEKLTPNAQRAGVKVTTAWLGRVVMQVLQGIAYLHANAVMHCDLKEANIMISDSEHWEDPQAIVIDFGLANNFSDNLDGAGGTPGYMPPEVWTDGLWTPKGDVHALGVIVYQLFSGERCFKGHDIKTIKHTTVYDKPRLPPLRQYTHLVSLVKPMFDKDFRQRPTVAHCLEHRFFKSIQKRSDAIAPDIISSLENMSKKNDLQQAILGDLVSSENLGQLRELNKMFTSLDANNDGVVTAIEAKAKLKEIMPSADVHRIVDALTGENGDIAYTKFMGRMMTSRAADENHLLWKEFQSLDADGNGSLNVLEIGQLMQRPALAALMGKDANVDKLMTAFDRNGDNKVTFEEFESVLRGETTEDGQRRSSTIYPSGPTYVVGQTLDYNSPSLGKWTPCTVMQVHESGAVHVNVRPGVWFSKREQSLRFRARQG